MVPMCSYGRGSIGAASRTTLGTPGTSIIKENEPFYGVTDFRGPAAHRGRDSRASMNQVTAGTTPCGWCSTSTPSCAALSQMANSNRFDRPPMPISTAHSGSSAILVAASSRCCMHLHTFACICCFLHQLLRSVLLLPFTRRCSRICRASPPAPPLAHTADPPHTGHTQPSTTKL